MNRIAAVVATVSLLPLSAAAQGGSGTVATVIEELVASNRVLAVQRILPGYGHVSVRHPENPNRYFLSRLIAPELVTTDDIVESDNPETGRGLAAALADRPAVLMRNHGIAVVGPWLSMVVGRSTTLEENAQMQSEVLTRGDEIIYLALEEEPEGFDFGRSRDLWKRQLPARP